MLRSQILIVLESMIIAIREMVSVVTAGGRNYRNGRERAMALLYSPFQEAFNLVNRGLSLSGL